MDGKEKGKTPKRLSLDEGLHDIRLEKEDYVTHTETVKVGDKIVQHTVELQPKMYNVDVVFEDVDETGWTLVDRNGALLYRDGRLVRAPATMQLPKGRHTVRLAKDGFKDITTSVTVTGVEEAPVVEVTKKPWKGYSSYKRRRLALIAGRWTRYSGYFRSDLVTEFRPNGTATDCFGGRGACSPRTGKHVVSEVDDVVYVKFLRDGERLKHQNWEKQLMGAADELGTARPGETAMTRVK